MSLANYSILQSRLKKHKGWDNFRMTRNVYYFFENSLRRLAFSALLFFTLVFTLYGMTQKNSFAKSVMFTLLLLLILFTLISIFPIRVFKNYYQKRLDYCSQYNVSDCPKSVCTLRNIGGGASLGVAIGCTAKMSFF